MPGTTELGLPFPRPSKIVCVGRNYLAHARELGNELPGEPLLFLKPPSALIPDGQPIVIPRGVGRVDFEGEIGVLIGSRIRAASPTAAAEAVAGVLPLNDVTARDLQRADGQWTRAKGFDTFCPVGKPVPVDSLEDLTVVTTVNGVERQRGSAGDMAFPIPDLLAYVSGIMTLEAGDLVATGTPEGVGPLEPGDQVRIQVPGVGAVANPVVSAT